MSKSRKGRIAAILMCLLIFAAGCFGSRMLCILRQEKGYVIYIGLNDKDTGRQTIETREAERLINAICVRHVKGYTSIEAKGTWRDEQNRLIKENTLVYYFRETDKITVVQIMDEVLETLNQKAILLEEVTASRAFYYGTGG